MPGLIKMLGIEALQYMYSLDGLISKCTAQDLMRVIDNLNSQFTANFDWVYQCIENTFRQFNANEMSIPLDYSIVRLCWNRNVLDNITFPNNFTIRWIHGHDLRSHENGDTLNNALGKCSYGGLQEEHFTERFFDNYPYRNHYAYGDKNRTQCVEAGTIFQPHFTVNKASSLTNINTANNPARLLFAPIRKTPVEELAEDSKNEWVLKPGKPT